MRVALPNSLTVDCGCRCWLRWTRRMLMDWTPKTSIMPSANLLTLPGIDSCKQSYLVSLTCDHSFLQQFFQFQDIKQLFTAHPIILFLLHYYIMCMCKFITTACDKFITTACATTAREQGSKCKSLKSEPTTKMSYIYNKEPPTHGKVWREPVRTHPVFYMPFYRRWEPTVFISN